jgi:thioredoxin reductase (NADPH)
LVIGPEPGGYINETHKIENYLGFPSIGGRELAQKMQEHVETLGGKIILAEVTKIQQTKEGFLVKTATGQPYNAKNLIYAIGTQPRKLNIPGESGLAGKGVSYCATCDAPFFKEKSVAVVGGGNSAAVAALVLAEHAKKVTIFYRGERLRCTPNYLEQMKKNPKIEIVCCTNLTRINGEQVVESVELDTPFEGSKQYKVDGVFIEIGSDPKFNLAGEIGVAHNKQGYIITKPDQSTNIEGFFAAGDISTNSNGFRQIITAAAEGAIAALAVNQRLRKSQ